MDFDLTAEQRMILEYGTKLSQTFDRKYWLDKAEKRECPREMWNKVGEDGFLGMMVDEAYGGAGLGMTEMALLMEGMANEGIPLLMLVVGPAMSLHPISNHGTDAQKAKFLPAGCRGELIFCFGITEPNAGTNTMRAETVAKREGDKFILNGQKVFITGADVADYALVVTRTTPFDEVSRKTDGFTLFDDDVLGEVGKGFDILFNCLNPERIIVGAMSVGLGRYALKRAVEYASERSVFGVPIGSHQGLQHPLAESHTEIEMATLMMRKAAWAYDKGLPAGAESNMCKFFGAEAAIKAVDRAVQCFGGNAYTKEYGIFDIYPVVRLMRTAPVNREVILSYIGEKVMGLPRSY
ncbi:MAG: acyl-CoA dehydrogenase family protein [Alphaproteobacteria bacterium]